MAQKVLLLLNPYAGKTAIKGYLLPIIDLFVKQGWNVTVYPTQQPGDAVTMAAEAAREFEILVVSGGDGTLSEVVTGLMAARERPAIGYLPSGTTNDFARTLGLPKKLTKAARMIVNKAPQEIDVGSFNQDYFVYIASFGAFTEVSYQTPRRLKMIFGHLAYVLESIKSFGSIRSYHLKGEHDGISFEGDYIFGMVTNSTSVGGFHFKKRTLFDVKLDDGKFEVALVRTPKNAWETQAIINDLLKQNLESHYIEIFKASKLTAFAEQEIPWTLDGEYGGAFRRVEIKNHKHAIRIFADEPGWLARKLESVSEKTEKEN